MYAYVGNVFLNASKDILSMTSQLSVLEVIPGYYTTLKRFYKTMLSSFQKAGMKMIKKEISNFIVLVPYLVILLLMQVGRS